MSYLPEILLGHDDEFLHVRKWHIYHIAIHEAAHAVADVWAGSTIDFVSIEKQKDEDGWFDGCSRVLKGPQLFADTLMVLAAGMTGEVKVTGIRDEKAEEPDQAEMRAACAREGIPPEEEIRFIARAHLRALILLEDEHIWEAVLEVADRLVNELRLKGPIVHEIVQRHLTSRARGEADSG
jgi:hypothetical protein